MLKLKTIGRITGLKLQEYYRFLSKKSRIGIEIEDDLSNNKDEAQEDH